MTPPMRIRRDTYEQLLNTPFRERRVKTEIAVEIGELIIVDGELNAKV